jgi:hypothetical protein
MGKRKNTESQRPFNAVDAAVILLCLLGAFFSFWFFWKDLNRAISRNQKPAGTITFKKGGAQRRLGDRVLWGRLRTDSPVYNEDFIRTAGLSDATITFNRGQKFSLSENSLIQIRTVKGQAVIDLSLGNISVENTGESALVLVSGNREVELSGIMKARVSENGDFNLEVLEGTAIINTGKDRIVQKAGQVFAVDAEGETIERPRVVMLRPRPNERFVSSGEILPVSFAWVPVNFTGTEQTRLEIAADRRFSRPVTTMELTGSSALVELPDGNYWWRAWVADSSSGLEDAAVSPEQLTIVRSGPISLISSLPAMPEETFADAPVEAPADMPENTAALPAQSPRPREPESLLPAAAERRPEDNYVIGPDQIRQSRTLTFQWTEVPEANGYIFTLRDAAGKTLIAGEPRAETSHTLDLRSIGQGNFVWQVEAVRRNGGNIERRGILAENHFTVDIPRPGNPRVRDTGILYGSEP